jgi:hypothetical protein
MFTEDPAPPLHQSQSPLYDLRDLCAMLSPFALFSPVSSGRSSKVFATNPNPPSVTSVTSVRCFPHSRCSRP